MADEDNRNTNNLIKFTDIPRLYPQSIFNKRGHTIRTQRNFIKGSLVGLAMLSEETFNPNEIKILFGIIPYIKLDRVSSGVLVEDGIPINKTRLMEILNNPNSNTFDTNIIRLEEKEIIKRVRFNNGTIYYVNPFIFLSGEQVEPYTFALFYQSKWNVYGD